MRYAYRYTKAERLRKSTAESVLADKAATPSDRMKAVRMLERLEAAARRRAEDREFELPEPTAPPPEPTVDDLVSQLEAQKQPSQPIEKKGAENQQNAINALGTTNPAEAVPEVTQIVPEAFNESRPDPATAFCTFCQAVGNWSTRWPVEEPNGILLCLSCFGRMCTADRLNAQAARQEAPADWAVDFARQRNTKSSDYELSVELWHRQAADQEAERERLIRQVEANEARRNRELAEFIQRGGRL